MKWFSTKPNRHHFSQSYMWFLIGGRTSTAKVWFQWCHSQSWSNQIRLRSLLGRNVLSPLQSGTLPNFILYLRETVYFHCFKRIILLWITWQLATNTLERVAPLTHAVGNVLKRVFVIGFSIIVFGNTSFF